MNFLRAIGVLFCVLVVLSVWGCLPEPESAPFSAERKLEMLENNQNY
jgi:hypothetical protein